MFPIGRPEKNKIDGDDEPAANKSGKIIPKFKIWWSNHFFIPISDKDARIKATVNSIPAETEMAILSGLGSATNNGEITPKVARISVSGVEGTVRRRREDDFGMMRYMIAAGDEGCQDKRSGRTVKKYYWKSIAWFGYRSKR